jgi:uncharacterized protein (DUF1919 family)
MQIAYYRFLKNLSIYLEQNLQWYYSTHYSRVYVFVLGTSLAQVLQFKIN